MFVSRIFAERLGISFFAVSLLICSGCQFTIPHQSVLDAEIDNLAAQGFTLVGAQKIRDMQNMKRPFGICREKRNVCGMQAGISAVFLLDPQEAFYDVKNPPSFISFGDGKTQYDGLGEKYPIMRPRALRSVDLGVMPNTLAAFWTLNLKYHQAVDLGFNTAEELEDKAKEEIKAGRPVLVQVRISAPGYPLYLPEEHLGPRGFNNAHWIVIVGFSDKEWLVRDNGGLEGTVDYKKSLSLLIRISKQSFTGLIDLSALSDDVKLYLDDPQLPVILDDWDNGDNDKQLRKDFEMMRPYNLIAFTKK